MATPPDHSDEERAAQAAAYVETWNAGLRSEISPPIHRLMGIEVVSVTPTCVVQIAANDMLRGLPPGSIHGGLLATLFDVASAVSLWGSFDASVEHPATTDLHVRYFRQPTSWPIRCEVEVVHAGRRLLSTRSVATDADARTLGTCSASFALVSRER